MNWSELDLQKLKERREKNAQNVADNRKAVRAKMAGKRDKGGQSESQMQKACVAWFRAQYKRELLLSFPNGGYHLAGDAKARAMQVNRMKAEGMMPGASDLVLIHDNGVAFLEAKKATGKLSESQKLFRAMVEAMGYQYTVFRSLDEFVEIVKKIMP